MWKKNAQKWLDKKYPKNAKEIKFNGYGLKLKPKSELVIADYPNLESIKPIGGHGGKIKNITKLTINNCPQLVKVYIPSWVDNQELTINNCPNLTELSCPNNKLTNLDLTNCPNLTELSCSDNQLTKLDLSDCPNLTELSCPNNKLTNLKFVQQLTKLEFLDITRNNITTGLQYLPLSLKEFECGWEIRDELTIYGRNLRAWQEAHPDLMTQAGKEPLIIDYTGIEPQKVTTIPEFLQKELSEDITFSVNYEPNLNYSSFLLRDGRPFSWEESNSSVNKVPPTRLYNISKGKNKLDVKNRAKLEKDVELTTPKEGEPFPINNNIKRYASMSYVCGLAKGEREIYANARKALNKVIKALELINKEAKTKINHVWIDQLCIIQDGAEGAKDKGLEIPKMRKYYNDSEVTLIAIDNELGKTNEGDELKLIKHILKKIVTSPWFKRSWTFQEGLLSKQTIFMFDDVLVDGRILALVWSRQKQHSSILEINSQIFVTPLGWSYGSQSKKTVNLTLGEALLAVKHREQTVSVDGIYALLGLLPYGNKVKTNYKPFGEKYTKKELEQVLIEVTREAINQGYGQEVFSWVSLRSNNSHWPIIPQVQINGSTRIKRIHDYRLKDIKISLQGIQLKSGVYRIDRIFSTSKFAIKSKGNKLILKENPKILEKNIQVGDDLILINNSLALLISSNINSIIGLVEFSLEFDSIKPASQEIFADLINKRIIFGAENIAYYQELIKGKDNQSELTTLLELNKWRIIHPSFTEESVQRWKEKSFTYEQVYEWASVFKDNFTLSAIDFYSWLGEQKQLTAKECEDEYHKKDRNQLTIDFWYPQFKQSRLYGIYQGSKSLDDLITIGETLDWAKIEAVLIREIRVFIRLGREWGEGKQHWDNSPAPTGTFGLRNVQFTYQVKSNGNWKLVKGKEYGNRKFKEEIIKLAMGEYLTKVEGSIFLSPCISSLSFHTTNSIYGTFGERGFKKNEFSLLVDNDKQAGVFCQDIGDSDRFPGSLNVSNFGIRQTPHQITKEDWDLIAQIEIPSKN